MDELVFIASAIIVICVIVQCCFLVTFSLGLKLKPKEFIDKDLPRAAVILCLRGTDPFLADNLKSISTQNYPDYRVKVVVDSQQDPAWKIVHDIVSHLKATNVDISYLKTIHQSCTLKCSSLVQAILDLDDSYQVIAMVDADTIVHRDWLRELVYPLQHPHVGATTGNRWYIPTGKYWGTLVRYIWNVSVVVVMWTLDIPWGGTMAIRRDVIEKTGLLNKWLNGFADDVITSHILEEHGFKIQFIPSLIMLNREECHLSGLVHWFHRQITTVKLYHKNCWMMRFCMLLFAIPTTLPLILMILSELTGHHQAAFRSFTMLMFYFLVCTAMAITAELSVRHIVRSQGKPVSDISLAVICKTFISAPIAIVAHLKASLAVYQMQRIHWRGVDYDVRGPWNIRLVEYRPYQPVQHSDVNFISL